MEISLRGRFGKYLNAIRVTNSENDQTQQNIVNTRGSNRSAVSYALGVSGQGIGELLDCLVFVSIDKKYVYLRTFYIAFFVIHFLKFSYFLYLLFCYH